MKNEIKITITISIHVSKENKISQISMTYQQHGEANMLVSSERKKKNYIEVLINKI